VPYAVPVSSSMVRRRGTPSYKRLPVHYFTIQRPLRSGILSALRTNNRIMKSASWSGFNVLLSSRLLPSILHRDTVASFGRSVGDGIQPSVTLILHTSWEFALYSAFSLSLSLSLSLSQSVIF
jgi:hypothetical protein